VFFPMGRAVWA